MEMNVGRCFGRGRPIRAVGPNQREMHQDPYAPTPANCGLYNPCLVNDAICGLDVTLSSGAVGNVDTVGGKTADLVNDTPPSLGISGETEVEIRSTMTEYEEMMKELEASNSSGMEENPVEENASMNQISVEITLAPRGGERKTPGATEAPPAKKVRQRRPESKPRKTRSLESKLMRVLPARRVTNRQVVPEEEKTAEYYAHRRKNTEAARRCRENKRVIDEQRVEIIKNLQKEIEMLHVQLAKVRNENEVLLKIWGPSPKQRQACWERKMARK